MAIKKSNLPAVRLDKKEKIIVKYIVGRLESAYRDSSGAPVYARNMDQVIKDVFGVKKFTRTLKKARANESLMIQLMNRMDTRTLWGICRSRDHYRILCYLIALDAAIVKKGRKYNKECDLSPQERSSKKLKSLQKEIKKYRKMYKNCVRALQDIFDIEHSGDGESGGILDAMSDWLERYDGGDDDIFSDIGGFSYNYDAIESMDEYVAKMTGGRGGARQSKRNVITGTLNLFDDDGYETTDIFDDITGGHDYDDDDDGYYVDAETARKIRQVMSSRKQYVQPQAPVMQVAQSVPAPMTSSEANIIINALNQGFNELNNNIVGLIDALREDDDEVEIEDPAYAVSYGAPIGPTGSPMNISEMMEASENNIPPTSGASQRPSPGAPIPGPDDP